MSQSDTTITRVNRSSWFILEYKDRIIHIDPGYAGLFENQGIHPETFDKKADFILISHPHKDHVRMDMIERIESPTTIILAPSSCQNGISIPFQVLNQPQSFLHEDILIQAVPAYNTEQGRSTRKYHPKGEYNGYLVTLGQKRIYFAGDTDCIPEMGTFGSLDLALLPIGGTYVMDVEEALEAASIMKPKWVIPMHQADNSMTLFQSKIHDLGLHCIVLNPGESFQI